MLPRIVLGPILRERQLTRLVNAMILLVASVHHTGTKTICNSVLAPFSGFLPHRPEPEGKLRLHIEECHLVDLEYWTGHAITIVPMRHPRSVAIGWKSRFKPLALLEKQWNQLKELAPRVDYYLPVDTEDRDEWVDKVNLDLKLNLFTDWPVIGQHGGEYFELDERENRQVDSWMADGFFEQFGYER